MRVDIQAPEKQKLKKDALLSTLSELTPRQINTWVDNNVNDIDDLKGILKKLIRLNIYLLKQIKQEVVIYFSTKYDKEIQEAVAKWWPSNIPWEWWKAQLYQESHFDPNAVSPVGAKGIAQFMPRTWRSISKKLGFSNVSPFSAKHSIEAGAYYMAKLAHIWSWDRPEIDKWDLARASYNAGPGNLLKAQKKTNNSILYRDIIKGLPLVTGKHSRETISYVQNIHRWYGQIIDK